MNYWWQTSLFPPETIVFWLAPTFERKKLIEQNDRVFGKRQIVLTVSSIEITSDQRFLAAALLGDDKLVGSMLQEGMPADFAVNGGQAALFYAAGLTSFYCSCRRERMLINKILMVIHPYLWLHGTTDLKPLQYWLLVEGRSRLRIIKVKTRLIGHVGTEVKQQFVCWNNYK